MSAFRKSIEDEQEAFETEINQNYTNWTTTNEQSMSAFRKSIEDEQEAFETEINQNYTNWTTTNEQSMSAFRKSIEDEQEAFETEINQNYTNWTTTNEQSMSAWQENMEQNQSDWKTDTYNELDKRMKAAENNVTDEAISEQINESLNSDPSTQETVAQVLNQYLIDHPLAEVVMDNTLTVEGAAADAKAVGDAINRVSEATTIAQNTAETAQSTAETATNIAKGRNRAHVFSTTNAMQTFLSNEGNKGLYNVGDNLYIVDVDVPDWWVAEVLDTADPSTGYYYKIAKLETQKVDLTEIETDINDLSDKADNSYSFKDYKEIPNGTDLNTLFTYGNYYVAAANASTISNIPVVDGFILRVERGAASVSVYRQTLTRWSTGESWYRVFNGSGWTGWDKISTNGYISNLFTFEAFPVIANGYVINSGLCSYAIGYKFGKLAIVKADFALAYFDTTQPLFIVTDDKYKPKINTNGHIRCWKDVRTDVGTNDFIGGNCYIDTEGNIWQTFNSDGSSTSWTGSIFVCYEIA